MANFLVYDFIMATQTESNDVSLDAKSCLSVPVPPSLFHGRRHPTCLSSTGGPNANQIPLLHDTFLRPKDVEVFSISGDGPCVSAFSPSAAPIPFFRLRGRPRVMRIEILSPCSIETNFADVWTLSGESWSVRKDTWTSFSKKKRKEEIIFR